MARERGEPGYWLVLRKHKKIIGVGLLAGKASEPV